MYKKAGQTGDNTNTTADDATSTAITSTCGA